MEAHKRFHHGKVVVHGNGPQELRSIIMRVDVYDMTLQNLPALLSNATKCKMPEILKVSNENI